MDTLAMALGVQFKTSKDEGLDAPTHSLEFLGIQVSTSPHVMAHPTSAKRDTIVAQSNQLL